jgi:hypothetical protein
MKKKNPSAGEEARVEGQEARAAVEEAPDLKRLTMRLPKAGLHSNALKLKAELMELP